MKYEEIKNGIDNQKELKGKEVFTFQGSREQLIQTSESEVSKLESGGLPEAERMATLVGLEVDEKTKKNLMEVNQEARSAREDFLAVTTDNKDSGEKDANAQITSKAEGGHIPFKGLKKVASEHTGLYEIEDKPKFVVRKEKFTLDGITHEGLTTKKTTEQLVKTKAMFSQLREKYGVPVLKFDYVIGENPDQKDTPALYTFEEKVRGNSLEKIESFEEGDLKKIDKAYSGILSQLSDSFESGEPFWLDAEQSQFIFGTREGETEKQPYIADLEPRIAHFKNLKNPEHFLLDRIYSLLHDIESIESKAQGSKMKNSREIIKKVFVKIPVPGPEDKYFGESVLPAYTEIAKRLE